MIRLIHARAVPSRARLRLAGLSLLLLALPTAGCRQNEPPAPAPTAVAPPADPPKEASPPPPPAPAPQPWRYTVRFPGPTKQRRVDLTTPEGPILLVGYEAQEPGGFKYAVGVLVSPAGSLKRIPAPVAISAGRDGLIRYGAGKLLTEKRITLEKHPGAEFTASMRLDGQDAKVAARIYVVADRVYVLAVTGPRADRRLAGKASAFFQSFKLLTPTP